jgi:hypothetical protein
MKIPELESQLAAVAAPLKDLLHKAGVLPEHFQLRVSLLKADGRKVRSDASADNWSGESGRVEIRFEPGSPEQKQVRSKNSRQIEGPLSAETPPVPENVTDSRILHAAEVELLRALDRAETKPGWNFVPLKKFRDEILPLEPPQQIPHLPSDVARHNVLRSVIEKRFVLVGKVPNPKSPQFPVTTIRLNRLMPEVKAALGQSGSSDLDFHPVEIQGEPLSATILRERR